MELYMRLNSVGFSWLFSKIEISFLCVGSNVDSITSCGSLQ